MEKVSEDQKFMTPSKRSLELDQSIDSSKEEGSKNVDHPKRLKMVPDCSPIDDTNKNLEVGDGNERMLPEENCNKDLDVLDKSGSLQINPNNVETGTIDLTSTGGSKGINNKKLSPSKLGLETVRNVNKVETDIGFSDASHSATIGGINPINPTRTCPSSITFSAPDEDIAEEIKLGNEIHSLKRLLLEKEQEWNALLKSLKSKELLIAQIIRRREMKAVVDEPMEASELKDLPVVPPAEVASARSEKQNEQYYNKFRRVKEALELEDRIHNVIVNTLAEDCKGNGNKMLNLLPSNSSSPAKLNNTGTKAGATISPKKSVQTLVEELHRFHSSRFLDHAVKTGQLEVKIAPPKQDLNEKIPCVPLNLSPNISYKMILLNCMKEANKNKNQRKPAKQRKHKIPSSTTTPSQSGRIINPSGNLVMTMTSPPLDVPRIESQIPSSTSTFLNELLKDPVSSILKIKTNENNSNLSSQQTRILCQECKRNPAQFVCSRCSKQWYCSKECQVAAWDAHGEVCSGDEED